MTGLLELHCHISMKKNELKADKEYWMMKLSVTGLLVESYCCISMEKNKLKEDREYQVIKLLDTVELYRIIQRILTGHGLVQIPASKMCGRRIVYTTIHTRTRPQLAYRIL